MASTRLPRDIRQFVTRYLPSVEHIEILMLLQRSPTRTWSAAEIAAELRIPEATAADILEGLGSDNFLDVKISSDILFRFNPATQALEESATRSLEFYRRERITMTNFLTSATLGPLHDFAEAFRLRRDDDNG